jgi:two-component system response regulator DegU
MKVLIVDDNPALRRLIGRVLGEMADDIRECADGAEALLAFQEYCPDLVLMDVEMARKDGISATRDIMAACPEARVVIVSRHDDEQIREAARQAGASAYVCKENLLKLRELIEETAYH